MTLNSLFCADVPLSNYSLNHACWIRFCRPTFAFIYGRSLV